MNNKLRKYHYYAIGFMEDGNEVDLYGDFEYYKTPTNEDIEPSILNLLQQKADILNQKIVGHKLMVAGGWRKENENIIQIFDYLRGWSDKK